MRKYEKKILKISISLFLFFEFLLASLFIYIYYRKYHYVDMGRLVAKINGIKIYEKDISNRLDLLSIDNGRKLNLDDLDKDVLKSLLLEEYVNKKIIILSKKNKVYNDKNDKFLLKEYHNRLAKERYINNFVFGDIDNDKILNKYNELVDIAKNKEERKISHILVDTKEEIERIRNNILRMNNFEKVAKERSLDTATAINGGSLGYIVKEEIIYPEFASVAFLLKKNELSKPIQTKIGWHIILVNDIRDIQIKSFEDSKENILNSIKQEKFDNFLNTLIDEKNIDENIKLFFNKKIKSYKDIPDGVTNNKSDDELINVINSINNSIE